MGTMHREPTEGKDTRTRRMQAMIDALIRIPGPRDVPSDVLRQAMSPIARFLAWFMVMMSVFVIAQSAIMTFFLRHRVSLWSRISLVVLLVPILGIAVWATRSKRQSRAIMIWGEKLQGRVLKVHPLPARINGRSLFRVVVGFTDANGTGRVGRDTVDTWSVEYFLGARDDEQDVDIIYYPGVPKRVILPRRIALERRLD
jgi:hypothetical protein